MCEKRLDIGMVDNLSIDDIELANEALDAWQDAEMRARRKSEKARK